jgi:hypothetical protein
MGESSITDDGLANFLKNGDFLSLKQSSRKLARGPFPVFFCPGRHPGPLPTISN